MTKLFIVRPFGANRPVLKRNGTEANVSYINFDRVETDLIKPASLLLGIQGGTTGEIFSAGDIREDMFSELLLADIVIADITIHNANVYYELGIRHALRANKTILIKAAGFDEAPFDIGGFRYLVYDHQNPAATLSNLHRTLEETIASSRNDSPVFQLLPNLKAQDPEKFLAIHPKFREEVSLAHESGHVGKLISLAKEARFSGWWLPANRLIAKCLFQMKSWHYCAQLLERVRAARPFDVSTNQRLATVYQRLADEQNEANAELAKELLAKSNFAIDLVIRNANSSSSEMAESFALKGRNAKSKWMNGWKNLSGTEQQIHALTDNDLDVAIANYECGFEQDLNHYYSGLNALGLLICKKQLAERYPEDFGYNYETAEDAANAKKQMDRRITALAQAVSFTIESVRNKNKRLSQPDEWLEVAGADLSCLMATDEKRVASRYRRLLDDFSSLNLDSVVRQLKLFNSLEVLPKNVAAALAALPAESAKTIERRILFTGHMIDRPDRTSPRFPPSKETAVRRAINEVLQKLLSSVSPQESLLGIAGGACGSDILFHELCAENNIPTKMLLALPREKFLVESVGFAGPNWIERFDNLYNKVPHPHLQNSKELPPWVPNNGEHSVWTRTNEWILYSGLQHGGENLTLIAVWNGIGGDGIGGTEHLVKQAQKRGAKVIIIDINKIA